MIKFTSVPTKRLATAITSASTTLQLSDIEGWDGADLTSADFGTTLYAVLRADDNSVMELMELDPATIASTSITITRRGLKFTGDVTTEVSGNKLTWLTTNTSVELGSDTPQMLQAIKNYIDAVAIAGSPTADTGTQGLVEVATQAEVDAGTATGGTGASLMVTPATLRASQYHDYAVDAEVTDAYAITLTPAPSAYAAGQTFLFKAATANTGACSLNVNSLGAKTLKNRAGADLVDNEILASQVVLVVYDGTNMRMIGRETSKFGGSGADGALTITSGTTTLDIGSAAYLVKNYTSISITGTGSLAFSNPHANGSTVVLLSQGAVTLTSSAAPMIDASGMGAAGAATHSSGVNYAGATGTPAYGYALVKVNAGTTTTGGALPVFSPDGAVIDQYTALYPWIMPGAGGGSSTCPSGTGAYTNGAGGRGGGALIIECAGAFNFTTSGGISVAGKNGANATVDSAGNSGTGGAGGGGAGTCIILYNSLVANSGTITVTGGTGGNTGASSGSPVGGGGGASYRTAGSDGGGASNGNKSGGDGAAGYSLVALNISRV